MSRTRPFSVAAVLAIVAASVIGGSASASAAVPSSITLDTPATGSDTSSTTITAAGVFGEALTETTSVTVRTRGETALDTIICAVDVPAGETAWTCDGDLQSGLNLIYAFAVATADPTGPLVDSLPPGGNVADDAAQVVNWGTEAPTAVSPGYGADVTDRTPTFSGTGPRLGSILVREGAETLCTATVDRDGAWACDSVELAYGDHSTVVVESTHYDGSPGSQTESPLTVLVPVPTATFAIGAATVATTATGDPSATLDISLGVYNAAIEGFDPVTDCAGAGPTLTCDYGVLAPATYTSSAGAQIGGENSNRQNGFFRIPVAPTISGTGGISRATLSGSATSGDTVRVSDASGAEVCVTQSVGGSWSCSTPATAGSRSYSAIAQDGGATFQASSDSDVESMTFLGLSARSASVYVLVQSPPRQAPVAPVVAPLVYTATFAWDGEELHPGDSTTLTGDGVPAGSLVEAELHSTPVALGSTAAADDGSFRLDVRVPEDIEPGEHHFVVFVTPTGEARTQFEQPVAITAVATPAEESTPDADESGVDAATDRNNLAAPTSFTTSLETLPELLAELIANPAVLGGAGLAAIALLLFVGFPAELLNATLSEQYDRFARRLPSGSGLGARVRDWFSRTPVLGGIWITVAAAFIFGFVDPAFGFDLASLRTVLACAVALFFVGFFSSALTGYIVKRRWSLPNVIELKPLGLILTVAGVVMSRVLDFSPGFLIGLILGLSLAASASAAQEAKASLIRAGIVFVLAVGAWIAYSVVIATGGTETAGGTFALDVLVAMTGEGLTALLIGLLPFRFLDGESVFAHSKPWWAIAWGVSAIAFLIIIVPSSWGEINGSLVLWTVILVGFALVALGVYLYFRFWAPKPEEADDEVRNPETHAVIPR